MDFKILKWILKTYLKNLPALFLLFSFNQKLGKPIHRQIFGCSGVAICHLPALQSCPSYFISPSLSFLCCETEITGFLLQRWGVKWHVMHRGCTKVQAPGTALSTILGELLSYLPSYVWVCEVCPQTLCRSSPKNPVRSPDPHGTV